MNVPSHLPVVELADGIAGRIQPGDGDAVLWLHGYTVDGSMWGDMWGRLPGWQHIGIDIPGHGASEPLARTGDLPALGRRLGQLCIARDIRHIVAISFGTITATQIAIEFPSHFSTLVLSAPSLAGGPHEKDIARVYSKLVQLYYQFGHGPWMRDVWMKCIIWAGIEKTPGVREELAALVDRHSWEEIKGVAMRLFTEPAQLEDALRRIDASVLVIIGERELPAFRAVAETLNRVVPRCQLLEFADADHLAMVQYPEASARAIEAHLRAHATRVPQIQNKEYRIQNTE